MKHRTVTLSEAKGLKLSLRFFTAFRMTEWKMTSV